MQQDPLIGRRLGAYLIQEKIGEGGMAQVYKAYHERLRREVAIKVILPQIADQVGFQERFEREAQLVASLEHRNIVAIYDFGEIGNITYLVMQYVGGGTLRDNLRKEGRIEPHQAVQYAIQMARALHHAHQRGIVHRDVKPQNMLISLSDSNELLLSDFGIAKMVESGGHETLLYTSSPTVQGPFNPSLTSVDQLVGTAEYMAPEQINRQPVDARTDVYALGIVLFQMLTGRIPFTSTTVDGLLFQHVYTAPMSAREVNPYVPEILEQIIYRALAKAPEHRFQSAEAMAVALEAVQASPTHEISVDNYSTFGQDPVTIASPNRTMPTIRTNYGSPVVAEAYQPNTPAIGVSSPGSGNIAAPFRPRAKSGFRLSYIMYSVILVAVIVLALTRVQPFLCANYNLVCIAAPSNLPGGNASFSSEDFHNNDHHWTIGNQDNGNLLASISNNQYALTIGSANNTYFPHPDPMGTSSGPLPQNFTLTVTMAQTSGDIYRHFGIAFRLQGDNQHVYSYVFAIKRAGYYEVIKYNMNNASPDTPVYTDIVSNMHTGLNQSNTLQVIARGNTFSFKVNDQPVLQGKAAYSFTDSDHPYTGGQLGIYVTGPSANFVVTSVALTKN